MTNAWPIYNAEADYNPANQEGNPVNEALKIQARDNAIASWLDNKEKLTFYKTNEMEARTKVFGILFPTPKKGTQRFALANGYNIKFVHTLNYKLGDPNKIGNEGEKISIEKQVNAVEDAIDALGPVAEKLCSRLFRWKPELVPAEYTSLDLDDPLERQIRDLVDTILTVEAGAPQMELEEPKKK